MRLLLLYQPSSIPSLGSLLSYSKRLTTPINRYSFDLYSAIRYTGIDEDLREKLWDDGLHLTSEGYKVMGDVIAVRMFELLKMTQQPKVIGPVSN